MADANGSELTPPTSLFLSTATLPARDRLPVWREVFGQTMVRLDIEPAKDTPFHAEGELCAWPSAALASVTATPFTVSRTQKLIAGDMADMVFLITADVPLHVAQNGREHMLESGDAIFLRGGERSVIQSRDKARFTNVSVPIDDLTPLLPNCREPSMTVVNGRSEFLDLLLGYAGLLQTRQKPHGDGLDGNGLDGNGLDGNGLGRLAAAHIRDLMAAMINSDPHCDRPVHERRGVRAARLKAIKADIVGQFCETRLSIVVIAARHGISPRYVRKLFQDEQTTFSDFVLLQRLERSRQLLRSSSHAATTIAMIAHMSGFNDLSYFNRTFRRRYGLTPSDFRALSK